VRALKELARILRVGGRILITVWAKEQRHRKVSQPRQSNASFFLTVYFFVVVSLSFCCILHFDIAAAAGSGSGSSRV
jgi:hypothetical protein